MHLIIFEIRYRECAQGPLFPKCVAGYRSTSILEPLIVHEYPTGGTSTVGASVPFVRPRFDTPA
jgi:hypothetical protein